MFNLKKQYQELVARCINNIYGIKLDPEKIVVISNKDTKTRGDYSINLKYLSKVANIDDPEFGIRLQNELELNKDPIYNEKFTLT